MRFRCKTWVTCRHPFSMALPTTPLSLSKERRFNNLGIIPRAVTLPCLIACTKMFNIQFHFISQLLHTSFERDMPLKHVSMDMFSRNIFLMKIKTFQRPFELIELSSIFVSDDLFRGPWSSVCYLLSAQAEFVQEVFLYFRNPFAPWASRFRLRRLVVSSTCKLSSKHLATKTHSTTNLLKKQAFPTVILIIEYGILQSVEIWRSQCLKNIALNLI